MEELLKNLSEVSHYLKSLSLHVNETRKSEVEKKIEEFELLVRRIELQQSNKLVSENKTKEVLNDLSKILQDLDDLCENRLARLDFLNKINLSS